MEQPHKTCNRCGEAKSVDQFYLNKQRGTRRSACIVCCKANPSPNSGKRTPERRAEYRRMRGEVATEYVLRVVTLEIAALKRIAKANAAPRERKPYAAIARPVVDDAHVRLFRSGTIQFRIKYKTDPEFALKQRLRTQTRKKAKLHPKLDDLMRDAIKRDGCSRTVADVCGYTIKELKIHLEQQFKDGMDWDAFMRGDIHIDHIKPQRLFDLSDADEVRACWALTNLQPLWQADNLRKGGRFHADRNESERYSRRGSNLTGIARPDLRLATQF